MNFGSEVLKNRDYRNLWFAQLSSQLGDSVYFLVFLFMAQKITGRPEVAGLIGVIQAIPFIFLSPVAGIVADWVDRRAILLVTDLASAAITLALAIGVVGNTSPPIWVIAVAAFSLSSIQAFFMPARSAAIPRLIPADKLPEAYGLAQSSQQLMGMLGIAISGSLLAVIYGLVPRFFFPTACVLNSLSFLVSAYFVSKIPSLKPEKPHDFGDSIWRNLPAATRLAIEDVKEGVRVIAKDPVSRLALPMNLITSLFVSGFMIVYIEANSRWYGGGFGTLALIEFTFSATCVVVSLWVGKLVIRRVGLAFALGTLACGVLITAMFFCRPYVPFLIANALCGLALPFMWIPMGAYMQAAFEDKVLGRVNAAWGMSWMCAQPIAYAGIGPLIHLAKLEGCFMIMGIGMMATSLIGFSSRAFLAPYSGQPIDNKAL